MHNILSNKNILLGVTGGIAAYKSAELIRLLTNADVNVRVVATQDGLKFITALTLQTLSKNPVYTDIVTPEDPMVHITLAKWADLILIAPATANIMGQLAHGIANDLLSTLCLATTAPIMIAPAMNQQMWHHVATQSNKNILLERGVRFIGPDAGEQACGDIGLGRMVEPEAIFNEMSLFFVPSLLKNKKIVITAGPTREAIDPVRYVSNRSSGKMGYALAEIAQRMGANTTLICGPSFMTPPHQVSVNKVETAAEMYQAVMDKIADCDIFISAAAVADYCCETISPTKIKKNDKSLMLALRPNKDILAEIANLKKPPFLVGFAAETDNLLENATKKLLNKKLDMIIANEVGNQMGFESDYNKATVLTKDEHYELAHQTKISLAREILQIIANKIHSPVIA